MKQFFLIDGFAFLYRAYYAVPEMKNFEGKNMNAVYGFLRMMLKRFAKHPDYVVIARDSPEETFRHKQFPDYKAQRKKMEDDFKDQIPLLRQIVEELGIPSVAIPGYEADDILASFVWKYKTHPDVELYLYSGDKDLKQVLDDHVFIMDPIKNVPYSKHDFMNEF
jgi:DNA polymerase-1